MTGSSLLAMQIPAGLSIVGTSLVLLTVICFKRLRAMRYVELVGYVAINDLLAAIGVCLGNQPSGSFACWLQGLGTSINFLSSIFWSTSIALQVYLIVHRGTGLQNMTIVHCVCWLLPVFLTLIPLSTNTYGQSDDDFWCFVSDRTDSPDWGTQFWDIAAFFFWLWLCIISILIMYVRVYLRIRRISQFSEMAVANSVKMLVLYPLILVICWLPPSIAIVQDSLLHKASSHPHALRRAALAAPTLQGCLLSIIFFAVNGFARLEWWNYFTKDSTLLDSLVSEELSNPTVSSPRTSEPSKSYLRQTSNTSGLSAPTVSTVKSSVFTMSDGEIWTSDDSSNSSAYGRSVLRSSVVATTMGASAASIHNDDI